MAEHDEYPMAGQTLGLWRLVRGIGRGGMGEVYEAEYDYEHLLAGKFSPERRERVVAELRQLSRGQLAKLAGDALGTPLPAEARFAIKVCNARSGTAGHRRFLQEADLATRLGSHPYIVGVHAVNGGIDDSGGVARRLELDHGRYRDVAFMVMDLASPRYDIGRLTIGEAVHMVRCIATALDHAHGKGVVHRDLKPENILGTVAHPMLTDFGIAKEVDHEEGLTRTGQIIGTLDYMSPEQATDAKRVDQRSDIYSLGVVLYEFATRGRLPWAHKADRESCLAAIRSPDEEPRWPREHIREFPVALERIILKATAHRPENRYQAMPELIADLDRFARGERIGAWGRVGFRPWVRYEVRSHPRLVWGGLTAVAALLFAVAAIEIPAMLDPNRRRIADNLAQVEATAARIVAREQGWSQLKDDDRRRLDDARSALASGGSRYHDLSGRMQALERTLLRSSRLDAVLGTRGGRSVGHSEALEQLRIAGRLPNPPWGLVGDTGLRMFDDVSVPLGPFGSGEVYARISVILPPGASAMRFEVGESNDRRRTVAWQLAGPGQLQLATREDLRPVKVVRTERVGDWVVLALHLSRGGLRAWCGRIESRHAIAPGSEDAPFSVRLELPRGSQLQLVSIWPEAPKE